MNRKGRFEIYLNNIFSIFDKYPKQYFVFGLFVLFFLIIIWKVFSYTVLNHDFYTTIAYNQQVGKVTVPVTRGTIYSSTASGTVLSTSVNLNDIAIDPTIEGDKVKLAIYLTDLVYSELCLSKEQKYCYNNMLRFLKLLEIEDFTMDADYIQKLILERLNKKLAQTKVTSVVIAEELEVEQVKEIAGLKLPGVYLVDVNLHINPEEISNPDLTSTQLSEVLRLEKETLKHRIRKREKRYIAILNKISISASEKVKDYITAEQKEINKGIMDKKDSIGGFIILEPRPNRLYPENTLGAHIIGFTDGDGVGRYGIEGEFNEVLKGQDTEIISKKDINGRLIDPIRFDENINDGQGYDIYTTIDRDIQKKAEYILERGVKQYNANKGTIVVMDPKTGALKAMADYPTYDPNNPGDVYELEKVTFGKYPNPAEDLLGKYVLVEDVKDGDELYYDGKKIFLRRATRDEIANPALVKYKYKNDFGAGVYKNDAVASLYEPGSIMKAITVAIGIDSGEITPNTLYNDKGELSIDNFHIKNVSEKCLGYHSFAHALNYSCNVGMIRIVQRYGEAIAYEYLSNFGFSEPTNISLKGEVYSTIEHYKKWSKAKLYTSSYGLGITVTPLQMATAYSVLANGGVYVRPRVIDYIKTSNDTIINYKTEFKRRVIKKETSDTMIAMLVDSVNNGVAGNGKVEGYNLAGKTGTSQIAYKGKYEIGVGSTVGSYAGFGPAEDPQYVVIVKLDRPRASNFGGATAAFLFKDVMEYLMDHAGIPKKIAK